MVLLGLSCSGTFGGMFTVSCTRIYLDIYHQIYSYIEYICNVKVNYMFDMFEFLISSHPQIFISLGSCGLACILASSHPHILIFVCACLYLAILISLYPYVHVLACTPPSSYPQVRMCLLVTSYRHILLFSDLCTLCACWYPCILTS